MDTFHAVVLLLHLLLMPIARFVKNKAGNSLSFFSFRSSICSFFSKIVLLKIFEKFRGECLCSPTHLFSFKFWKILKKIFFTGHICFGQMLLFFGNRQSHFDNHNNYEKYFLTSSSLLYFFFSSCCYSNFIKLKSTFTSKITCHFFQKFFDVKLSHYFEIKKL